MEFFKLMPQHLLENSERHLVKNSEQIENFAYCVSNRVNRFQYASANIHFQYNL